MKKILSINQIQVITAIPKPKLKPASTPHLLISLDHKQNHHKTVHKHSRIKQVDPKDPGPGQLIRKKKIEKKERTEFITKTCLYNFDPLEPHFCIVKLGFTGVYIIFHISAQNIGCGYSLEPPRQGGSKEYPQSIF